MLIVSQQNKFCRTCKSTKPLDQFYVHTFKNGKAYHATDCKNCLCDKRKLKRKSDLKNRQIGTVYFIFAEEVNRVKIGYTTLNPQARLRNIQGMCSSDLTLLGTKPGNTGDEQELHDLFRSSHSHCEWFYMTDEIREYIKQNTEPETL